MSKLRSIGILFVILFTVYVGAVIARANHLLFATATGYVYHPLSDSLFEVTISPFALDRRDLLNPFADVLFHEIRHTKPLGRLSEVLASREVDRRLLHENPDAWLEKRQAERRGRVQRLKEQLITGRERVDVSFYSRPGFSLRTFLRFSLALGLIFLVTRPKSCWETRWSWHESLASRPLFNYLRVSFSCEVRALSV